MMMLDLGCLLLHGAGTLMTNMNFRACRGALTAMAHLQNGTLLVDDQGQQRAWRQQKYDPEGVHLLVICVSDYTVEAHVVDDGEGCCQEYQLHHCVVPADRRRASSGASRSFALQGRGAATALTFSENA
jgi:hypothetical protein